MGLRAYFLIEAVDDIKQGELAKSIREMEKMPGIDSVDPVTGPIGGLVYYNVSYTKDYQLKVDSVDQGTGPTGVVALVDAPITVQALANKVKTKPWVKNIRVLRIVSVFERQKTVKTSNTPIFELAGIPSAEIAPVSQSVPIYGLLGVAGVVTESRAYFLINAMDNMDQRDFIKAVRDVEEMRGVDYVDPVIGPPDMVVMVDATAGVEALADELKKKPWVKGLEVLNIARVFEPYRPAEAEPAKVPAEAPESVSVYKLLGISKKW